MVQGLPVPTLVPPQEPEYHFLIEPVPKNPPEPVRVTLVPEQTVVAFGLTKVGSVETA